MHLPNDGHVDNSIRVIRTFLKKNTEESERTGQVSVISTSVLQLRKMPSRQNDTGQEHGIVALSQKH